MSLFRCSDPRGFLDLPVRRRAMVMGWSSFGIIFKSKNRFEQSIPTDGAKLLEHSFSRMTWRASIRQVIDDDGGVWIGLTAK
jgi:hypothetical protein